MSAFKLDIELGSATMKDAHDVAAVLRILAKKLDRDSDHIASASTPHAGGMVFDVNGNKRGDWTIELPQATAEEVR